jgi:site-specific DNA-cytosine methylase
VKVDVVVAWLMCRHLSVAGLRRMQADDCASQLWDIVAAVSHFKPLLVGVENVVQLEEDEAKHGLIETATQQFEVIGYVLVAVWRLLDPELSGYSQRKRAWLIFEPVRATASLPIFHQPVRD